MPGNYLHRILTTVLMASCAFVAVHAQTLEQLWKNPTNDYRVKTWWFFGYEHTTDAGITSDVEELSKAGFGGVVYYDQNHRSVRNLPSGTPDEGFSPDWWHHLRFAASEARRVGLSFELNISNGYCAGGRWIDAGHAMQRVACAKLRVTGGEELSLDLPAINGREGYVKDIALLAFPYCDDGQMRHVTARYVPRGKGRNGAMQGPGLVGDNGSFSGYGFKSLPDVGTLQASDDSLKWRDVLTLQPMYRSQGVYPFRTNAFPATAGRYWRIRHNDGTFDYEGHASGDIREWSVGKEALLDCWEERAALQSDFAEDEHTPQYTAREIISPYDIIDLSDKVDGQRLRWKAPKGEWTIIRLAAVLTGAKSKHGRDNLLGYECDKLSAEAANLHWDSYVKVILDSIGPLVQGITMDSHEGGSQNWTPRMLDEFRLRRGYDFSPWLPVLAGYIVESKEKTSQVLYDYRLTIADCLRDNYFGIFQRRAAECGLTFTAQAIGNALCITGDAISVKQAVEKPQGEFWTYQRDGAYDIKDCSSAAHLYGKSIASAEAMTDCEYKDTPADLLRVSNIALSMGAQEFVVCATPHIPYPQPTKRPNVQTDGTPYIAGREYAINRSNPKWQDMQPVWLQAARSMVLLRQGLAAPDVLVYLGDDIPMKIITNRLPPKLEGLDWDACTGDALKSLKLQDNQLVTESGVTYKALLMSKGAMVTEESRQLIDEWQAAGFPILQSGESVPRSISLERGAESVVHTHRHLCEQELFYIANIENHDAEVVFKLQDRPQKVTIWHHATGQRTTLKSRTDNTYRLRLKPVESVCITYFYDDKTGDN
jgi:hypothetical protein